ncbi:Gamma-aminobutyric acid receptor subunit epsilon [Tupaia chinensis]|uniref:Gamma-aminobutyric acid receptor subunit epsilon n=1 Tax=Tupaia chinensis TaxID=246437 RepID=L8Y991_TUPCH|nr:Gamma-aminobutyric acid receptor subunit epsilon [Tupaia chinensis]
MSPKVLLVLLGIFLILQSRVEGPQDAVNNEASTHKDVSHGPEPEPLGRKLLSEESKPTAEVGRKAGKLPEASRILNTILSNYDHKLRPGIGEKPTVVTVEISVNSLGPLSILDMEYTIDIIFCQTWYDERLRYNDTFETLVLNGNLVSQLWIPDTFFRNSKRTQEHEITMPNQMVRIHKDGKVLYTIRMTIDAGCSLHLLRFPMDSHSCPLSFSSWITSVLTMTTLGTFSRKNFPRVSYITALDFYIAICFIFCFCALTEFTVLNFLTYNQMKAHASPKLRHV